MLHELQVSQIERRMQNEVLVAARASVKDGLSQYTALYDFAPVAYATLGADGIILRCNLACARLLGSDREQLQQQCLGRFVAAAERPMFADWLRHVFSGDAPASCQIQLAGDRTEAAAGGQGAPDPVDCVVRIYAERATDRLSCFAALIDLNPQLTAAAALRASEG